MAKLLEFPKPTGEHNPLERKEGLLLQFPAPVDLSPVLPDYLNPNSDGVA